jgi:hypothetical protein
MDAPRETPAPETVPARNERVIARCLFAGGLLFKEDAAAPDFYRNGIGWIARSNDFVPPRTGQAGLLSRDSLLGQRMAAKIDCHPGKPR